jgi:ABC-type multidrug transport system ATPase subunit
MDPLSRRRLWECLLAVKSNAVSVLTTHSMEEADALGDKIVILSQGRMRACGDQLFLKEHYGKGYQVSEPEA